MGVQDGFPVSAGYTNPRFISKNTPDVMPFPLGFTGSGAAIADIQVAVNKLYDATGASESTTGTVYNATAGTVSNGDTYEECITILANKFDAATGHKHTGSAGDAPILDVVLTAAVSGTGGTPVFGNITFEAGTGVTINQIGNNFIFNSAAGTTVGASGYAQLSGDVTLVAGTGGITITQSGQNITFNASPGMTLAASGNTPLSGAVTLSQGTGITLTQTGQDIEIAATGGSGLKNYLSTVNGVNGNGNFELGSTSKWSLFNTTLTGVIPTGSISAGAGSITTFAVVSSGQLAGQYSLNVGGSGAITAGQGFISDAFTLDLEDYAKVMQLKFYYEAVTGASNMNFSGTSSNTWAMYLYDVTNSEWVQPAGVYNLIQNAGVGIANGTFQTGASTSQYRLAIICINATAGATNTYFDDFFFGPQITAAGAAISDWTQYTPTLSAGFGTATNISFEYRRVGDTLQVRGTFTTGTVAASLGTITLPSGFSIDSLKISISNTTSNPGEQVGIWDQASASSAGAIVTAVGTSTSLVYFAGGFGTSSQLTPLNVSSGTTNGSNTVTSVSFNLPIAGWSSNTVMSNDTDTRVITAKTTGSGTSFGTGGATLVPTTINKDTAGMINPSTGVITIPVSGFYIFGAYLRTASSTTYIQLYYSKNGGSDVQFGGSGTTTSQTFNNASGTGGDYFNAGDTLAIKGYASTTVTSDLAFTYIQRVSGPATIAASDTVAMRVGASTTTITNNAATTVIFTSVSLDTTNNYNISTGEFTIPISGTYRVSSMLTTGLFVPAATTSTFETRILKNGTIITNGIGGAKSTSSAIQSCYVTDLHKFLAGDVIKIQCFHDLGVTPTLQSTAPYTNFSLERVGN